MTKTSVRILVVEARYYADISDALLKGALAVLKEAGAEIEQIVVPGALEVPGAIAMASASGQAAGPTFDGFVALGCVIRGETTHYEIVSNESARGLMDLSINQRLAIGNGILTVENEAQANERAKGGRAGKGGDAARACLRLIEIKRSFWGPSQ